MKNIVANMIFYEENNTKYNVPYQLNVPDNMEPQELDEKFKSIISKNYRPGMTPEDFYNNISNPLKNIGCTINELDRGTTTVVIFDKNKNATVSSGPLIASCISCSGKPLPNNGISMDLRKDIVEALFGDNENNSYRIIVDMDDDISFYDEETDSIGIAFNNPELLKYRVVIYNAKKHFNRNDSLFGRCEGVGWIGRISQIMALGHVEPNRYEELMDIDIKDPLVQLAGILYDFYVNDQDLGNDIRILKAKRPIKNDESADEYINDPDTITEYSIQDFYSVEICSNPKYSSL